MIAPREALTATNAAMKYHIIWHLLNTEEGVEPSNLPAYLVSMDN
jgi:hypothetical protein